MSQGLPAHAAVFHSPGLDLSAATGAIPPQRLRVAQVTWPVARTPDSRPSIYVVDAAELAADADPLPALRGLRSSDSAVFIAGADPALLERLSDAIDGSVELPLPSQAFKSLLLQAIALINQRRQEQLLRSQLIDRNREMSEIHEVGIALSGERDFDTLQSFILLKCRQMTNADAGTLYLLEDGPKGEPILRFSYSQNDSIKNSYQRFTIPIDTSSMAGYVAATGNIVCIADSYELPDEAAFTFNPGFDRAMGYRTKSQLVVPLANHANEIIGVIQLMNRKHHWEARLDSPEIVEQEVGEFTEEDQALVRSFAGQAAVALDNKLLLDSIQNLFEGFVKAAVTAIESRDPTTSGHSGRVADLTVGLASAINGIQVGRFADVHFDPELLRELRYASLLHDFGKVGVREAVLLKAKKLFEGDMEVVRKRFAYLKAKMRADLSQQKLDLLLVGGREQYDLVVPELDARYTEAIRRLDDGLRWVLAANEPTVTDQTSLDSLRGLLEIVFIDEEGKTARLLEPRELQLLSIRRGSLDEQERQEINSHVSHTFRFLSEIPWTKALNRVPNIAHAHHERLDGTGYPLGLSQEEIPIQSRMMAISDIYDALTASDRPYKPAVPLDRAIDILNLEVKDGHVDAELLEIFVERRIYELTARSR